jgi:RimJ/RimL family protein N-acetyltransferase
MILREATALDMKFFFDLRNDPESVRFSYTKRGPSWKEHQTWWHKTDDHCFVATDFDRDIGYVRLTPLDDSTCEIHFAIVPEQRGKGWAGFLLERGREEARHLGFTHIIARVDAPNTPSIRAFLREGYQITSAGTLFLERDV